MVRHLIHLTLLAFAGASLGNVREFFGMAGHPDAVAWPMAIALSSALVLLSLMLTHVDRESGGTAFGWLLFTALLVGAISGSLQMHVYQQHLPWHWAILLGFGIPLIGEVCLSISVSAYIKARGRERYRNVSLTLETAVADRLEDAIAAIDAETIQQHVEQTINLLAQRAVDNVAARALSYYQPSQLHHAPLERTSANGFGPQNLSAARERLTEVTTRRNLERREAILSLLGNQGAQSTGTIANHLGVHRDTARAACTDLEKGGHVIKNGQKWQLSQVEHDERTDNERT